MKTKQSIGIGIVGLLATTATVVYLWQDGEVPSGRIVWDPSTDAAVASIVYQVQKSTNLEFWEVYVETPETYAAIQFTGQCGFFRVRCRDVNDPLTNWSDWSIKTP